MPNCVRAHVHVPSSGQTRRPKDPESSETISRFVQPPTYGMPLECPPSLCQRGQREFHLSLQGNPLKTTSACPVPNHSKIVSHDPCSAPTMCVREQCQSGTAPCGLRHLCIVAAWEGYYRGGEQSRLTSVGWEMPQRGPRSRYLAV